MSTTCHAPTKNFPLREDFGLFDPGVKRDVRVVEEPRHGPRRRIHGMRVLFHKRAKPILVTAIQTAEEVTIPPLFANR